MGRSGSWHGKAHWQQASPGYGLKDPAGHGVYLPGLCSQKLTDDPPQHWPHELCVSPQHLLVPHPHLSPESVLPIGWYPHFRAASRACTACLTDPEAAQAREQPDRQSDVCRACQVTAGC